MKTRRVKSRLCKIPCIDNKMIRSRLCGYLHLLRKALKNFYLPTDNALLSLSDLFVTAINSLAKVTAVPSEGRVPENCSKYRNAWLCGLKNQISDIELTI